MSNVAGRGRTCDAPRFRRALYRAELRPRSGGRVAFHPSPLEGRSTQWRPIVFRMSRASRRRRCFPCHSLTLRPWIVHPRLIERGWSPSYVEELWSRTLGPFENIAGRIKVQIHTAIFARTRRAFLSRAGPRFELVFLQAGHHFLSSRLVRLRNDEGDPLGRPRESALRQRSSASAAPRGPRPTPPCVGTRPA